MINAANKWKRRLLLAGVTGLLLVVADFGISFLGNTGTVAVSVTAGSSNGNIVFPISAGAAAPSELSTLGYSSTTVFTTEYGSTVSIGTTNTFSTAKNPGWTPVANSAGSVTTAGDIALIDASSYAIGSAADVYLSVYITNLTNLQYDYSSFAFPFDIYKCSATGATCTSASAWTSVYPSGSAPFITNTDGVVTIELPAGYFYDVTFDTGGSFYCISVSTTSPASLSPTFYLAAQPV